MKTDKSPAKGELSSLATATLLLAILSLMFWRSFLPDYVHFSNDGPLGQMMPAWIQPMTGLTGMWDDITSVGLNCGARPPAPTSFIQYLLGVLGSAKFYTAVTILISSIGAWIFFRALKFSPVAALFGALAVMFNSTFFSDACWGLGTHEIALGMNFLALALVISNTRETPWHIYWARLALAGICVGINVMEAADIGALYSLVIAAFVFFKSLTETDTAWGKKIIKGAGHVLVIAIFAGFIACQTIISLVGTSIQGVAGTEQNTETKAQKWDWATQWSLPKKETLGLIVPGLFGYKMDTPKDMMPQFKDYYEGGIYWGGIGRDPNLDRFLDQGGQGMPPSGFMRFTGGTNYCGILVLLVVAWTIAQSLRRQNSVFNDLEKRLIWFWAAIFVVALPLAWGRFAPGSTSSDGVLFYALLYKLPYFSTIRNPIKFLIILSWAAVILFGFGMNALTRRHLARGENSAGDISTQLKLWWSRAAGFERKWVWGCLGVLAASIVGWLIYAGSGEQLAGYLQKMGFPDSNTAKEIAAFSQRQLGWFVLLFAVASGLLVMTFAGCFKGRRATLGAILLGLFLVFDLVRADLPYVIHWDYKKKYEVDSLNPIVDFLRQKPYEHRVAGLPFRAPEGLELLDQIYRIEWMQHHFPYYNIQCLDLIQMPRMSADLKAYLEAFVPRSNETAGLIARHWQLTNTRFLLGAAGFAEVMNQQFDPAQRRFQIRQRFEIAPKPGITRPMQLEDLTAYPNDKGNFALIEFTGALPRIKLYSNWQVNTNDEANLKTLADLNFDPAKTVLISTPQKDLPAVSTNENSGTVEFKSYSPKHIVLAADAKTPSVLLLNDKYDPNWKVSVDGKPTELLRCNFLMRGVYLEPGKHTVVFDFSLPNKPLYVTLAAIIVGALLCAYLLIKTRKRAQ